MPDRDVLQGLLDRVRAAEGPDRELDALIWWAFADHTDDHPDIAHLAAQQGPLAVIDKYWPPHWRTNFLSSIQHLTRSIDAAVALMERELPGWDIHFYPEGEGRPGYVAEMDWPADALVGDANYFGVNGRGLTRPLAVVAAVLEAKLTLSRKDRPHGR
ncbi:hypothetical protein [uncultured Methylobacterium sp.]|uniref:hypothetical protein n=1 Tax=uncultured Methylobacterium sp. TaxID=157278 RepID=UPI0035CA54F4